MPLVERLMGLAADGVTPDPDNAIAVHSFFAAQQQVTANKITVANVKAFLNMDTATAAEYDTLVALYPPGTTAAAYFNKSQYIQNLHSAFILAEKRYPGYSTPAEVRAKLGL